MPNMMLGYRETNAVYNGLLLEWHLSTCQFFLSFKLALVPPHGYGCTKAMCTAKLTQLVHPQMAQYLNY
ncbi:hypothetical protein XELAEV_18041816mg [Xenopus laevis]|uniref:Uncharacterized protein n=1 Tax=Xenopus laevis TaxID=8355 RepID=A0A974C319_XENLA|nr:hypothetical protein XELAEV_18041816mg [Xenopus laevis]